MSIQDKRYPQPENSKDWIDWARKFLNEFTRRDKNQPLVLPQYLISKLPKASGLDGMTVMVSNDVRGKVPVYSKDGLWLRYSDDTPTSDV